MRYTGFKFVPLPIYCALISLSARLSHSIILVHLIIARSLPKCLLRVNANNKNDKLIEFEIKREDFNKVMNNPVGKEPNKNLDENFERLLLFSARMELSEGNLTGGGGAIYVW